MLIGMRTWTVKPLGFGLALLAVLGGCGGKSAGSAPFPDDSGPREVPLLFMTGAQNTHRVDLHAVDSSGKSRVLSGFNVPEQVLTPIRNGHWSDGDIVIEPSPDGRFVAWACPWCFGYDAQKSELVIVDTEGKKSASIPGLGFTMGSRLRWSPDGRWLAVVLPDYRKPTRLAIIAPSGEVRDLAVADAISEVEWAPDSSMIAYTVFDSWSEATHLHTVSVNGTDREIARDIRLCAAAREPGKFYDLWSPDGTRLLYLETTRILGGDSAPLVRVLAARPDGSGVDPVVTAPRYESGPSSCSWAQGGESVLLRAANPDRILLATLGGDTRTVVEVAGETVFRDGWFSRPFSVSPSDDRIAYTTLEGGSKVLRTADLEGQIERDWASVENDPESLAWIWEAQGRYAFLSFRSNDVTSVSSADMGSGQDFPLTVNWISTNVERVGFSPDGSRVVFQKAIGYDPATWEVFYQYSATKPDGTDELVMPPGDFGYMADGRLIAAAHENAISLQALGAEPRVIWEGTQTHGLMYTRFPIDAEPSARRGY
jgi:hypothetical protein